MNVARLGILFAIVQIVLVVLVAEVEEAAEVRVLYCCIFEI